ncbi:MAG: tyrosine-type recombinase/integrase [Oscillospiraceae bacterium]|nr:tyrosine-type recombinase/integrase [Oscillospiraceae bacterium]
MPRKTKHNTITSPELLAKVNPENTALLNDFLDYLRSTDKSAGTIAAYESDIEIAFVWCLQHNENRFFVDWTKRQIVQYQNWLINENGNSPARVRRLKASLSSMANFTESILDDEFPNFRNIINKVESPINQPVREKTIFTSSQIVGLLEYLTERGAYEKACAVALALYSGRRKAELLRFRVSDFTDDRLVCGGSLYKTGKIKTKGRGAQGKMLECFCLAKQFKPYLDRWLEYRERNGIESEWLFPSKEDPSVPLGIATLNSWAMSFSRYLDMDFYWHSLRHLCVSDFKRAGIPDTVIQQYIGWEDISMVPVYSDLQADEQLSMYFNEDGIVKPEQKDLSEI